MDSKLEQEIKDALRFMVSQHGEAFTKGIEQLFRNETRHFKSGNFIKTLSPGMEATHHEMPYGWTSLVDFWKSNEQYAPSSLFNEVDNKSELSESRGERTFICFPNVKASMMTVAKVIEIKGSFGKWFNNIPADQTAYEQTLNEIIPRFTNEIILKS